MRRDARIDCANSQMIIGLAVDFHDALLPDCGQARRTRASACARVPPAPIFHKVASPNPIEKALAVRSPQNTKSIGLGDPCTRPITGQNRFKCPQKFRANLRRVGNIGTPGRNLRRQGIRNPPPVHNHRRLPRHLRDLNPIRESGRICRRKERGRGRGIRVVIFRRRAGKRKQHRRRAREEQRGGGAGDKAPASRHNRKCAARSA